MAEMLDVKLIRNDPDRIKKAAGDKRIDCDVDRLIAVDARRRALQMELDALRSEVKESGQLVGLLRNPKSAGYKNALDEGKTPEQILAIVSKLIEQGQHVLATRASRDVYDHCHAAIKDLKFHPASGLITNLDLDESGGEGLVMVISAGTADLPVAEEAALTARACGSHVETVYDAGVAGLHRLLVHTARLQQARALVVCAGMEGALPSVVGGLVAAPVIAVPTSIGYGASFKGLAALLAMLNSCASNVTVVNIDNGFGAGHVASLINLQRQSPIAERKGEEASLEPSRS